MENTEAKLVSCKDSGCGWKCCNFGKDGHIIMLPNELEQAVGSIIHLEVIDDNYRGGKKVKCRASDTSTCDGGYKPIQCGVYPLWVTEATEVVRSMKCPLNDLSVKVHKDKALSIVSEYADSNPEIDVYDFVNKAEVDNYDKL